MKHFSKVHSARLFKRLTKGRSQKRSKLFKHSRKIEFCELRRKYWLVS